MIKIQNSWFKIVHQKLKLLELKTLADNMAKVLEIDFSGMLLKINDKEFWTPLIGKFNASNF